jgi:hypothetical protein
MNDQLIEKQLREKFESNIKQRVKRLLKFKHHVITASTHFAAVSHEASLLFIDGHFYGCISLAQAVAEALVKFMCQRNKFKAGKDFTSNVDNLYKRNFIDESLKKTFLEIWDKRNDYHHLNSSIENDKIKLELLAENKVNNLNLIEKEIFYFSNSKGSIVPKYPKYWDIKDGYTPAYLKIEL